MNDYKKLTDKNKEQSPKTKSNRGKKTRTKSHGPELEAETNFKGRFSDLEGYIFDIGPIASDNFTRTMKDMERYIDVTYKYSYKPSITNNTPAKFLL